MRDLTDHDKAFGISAEQMNLEQLMSELRLR